MQTEIVSEFCSVKMSRDSYVQHNATLLTDLSYEQCSKYKTYHRYISNYRLFKSVPDSIYPEIRYLGFNPRYQFFLAERFNDVIIRL